MITILAQGKARQEFVKLGIQEFLKRLQKYGRIEYKEIDTFNTLKLADTFLITLDETGTQYSSQQFAEFIKKKTMQHKNITFCIGEARGLPQTIKQQANHSLCLSKMTFPTQLVRVIFLEQLYRAFTIISNEPYHKE